MATFKQVKGPNFKKLDKTLIDGGKQVLSAEVKRIARDRYRPLVRRWQKENKPKYRTSTKVKGNIVTAQIIEDSPGKPIAKWVHRTGTRSNYPITPTKPHGLLVFKGRNGKMAFVRGTIMHPGISPSGEHDKIQREEPPKIKNTLEIVIGGKFLAIK